MTATLIWVTVQKRLGTTGLDQKHVKLAKLPE